MKVRVLIMAMMVAFTSFANAQEQQVESKQAPQLDDKIEAHVKRMTDRFLLDDSKAAKFAPLYKEYLEAKAACRPELVLGENLTDAQLEANIEAMLEVREKAVEVDKKYYKKLSKLLNAKQLDMIFGPKAQFGQRFMHDKGMSSHHFGKSGAPKGFRKGGHRKAHGCKKDGKCTNGEACPKAGECKKDGACNDGKCVKGKACPKATECKDATVYDKAADSKE